MKDELLIIADHVVSAVLNGVFQGIILVLLVALALRWLARTNAATRHAIWFVTLLLLVLLIPLHYRVDRPDRDSPALLPPEATGAWSRPVPKEDTASFSQGGQEPNREATSNPSKSFKPAFFKISLPEILARPLGAVLLAVWVLLGFIKLILLFWRLREIRKLKLDSLPAPAPLQELFLKIREDLRIKRPVELRVSIRRSPVVLGFAHPVILLPREGPESAEIAHVEPILRHELAHVARRDDWTNLIQHSIRAVFFFHPAIWWVSRRLSLEREIACDDSVLHRSGRPRSYALLLAELAGRSDVSQPVFAPGVSNNKSQLQTRINMILNTRRNTSPHLAGAGLGIFTMVAVVAALLGVYAVPRLVLAQAAVPPVPAVAPQAFPSPQITPGSELAPAAVPVQAELADTEASDPDVPSTPLPSKVPLGAKYKPGDAPSDDTPPPAYLPSTPKAPRAPKVLAFPKAPKAPVPADLAITADPANGPEAKTESSSIEERLARVEKMVRSIMRRQNLDEPRHGSHNGDGLAENEMMQMQNELRHVQEIAKRQAEQATEQAKRAVEQAKRQVELATEQAKRAVAQAKREAELHGSGSEQDKHNAMPDEQGSGKETQRYRREFLRDNSSRELDALQKEHDKLEKEMERLNRRMERLQQDKQRLEKDQQGVNESRSQPEEPEPSGPNQAVNFEPSRGL